MNKMLGKRCERPPELDALLRRPAPVSVEPKFTPTHQHRDGSLVRLVRRGGLCYTRMRPSSLAQRLVDAVIYETWYGLVRVIPAAEFDDGRFTEISEG